MAQFCKVPEIHDDVPISGGPGRPSVPEVYRVNSVSLQGCPRSHDEVVLDLDLRIPLVVVQDTRAESKEFILAYSYLQEIFVAAEVLFCLIKVGFQD